MLARAAEGGQQRAGEPGGDAAVLELGVDAHAPDPGVVRVQESDGLESGDAAVLAPDPELAGQQALGVPLDDAADIEEVVELAGEAGDRAVVVGAIRLEHG